MTAASPPRSAVGALLRTLGATALALALLTLGIARLARVMRPRFVAVEQVDGDGVTLGRVELARPGARDGRLLGWAVQCRGREVASALGPERPSVSREDGGVVLRRNAGVPRFVSLAGCR